MGPTHGTHPYGPTSSRALFGGCGGLRCLRWELPRGSVRFGRFGRRREHARVRRRDDRERRQCEGGWRRSVRWRARVWSHYLQNPLERDLLCGPGGWLVDVRLRRRCDLPFYGWRKPTHGPQVRKRRGLLRWNRVLCDSGEQPNGFGLQNRVWKQRRAALRFGRVPHGVCGQRALLQQQDRRLGLAPALRHLWWKRRLKSQSLPASTGMAPYRGAGETSASASRDDESFAASVDASVGGIASAGSP